MNHLHSNPSRAEKQFLFPGGGEMGALMRSKDWCNTILGPVEQWPQSLLITLNIILHSRFPMFLWWGPELICFYNDAYRPSLGENGKHPSILGVPAKSAWPEIWEVIKPLIDQVLNSGEATWSEDQLIPIFRNGKVEDVYWTFSYSPVNDETGGIAGVLVTCNETTDKVKTVKILEESNRRYLNNMAQAPVAMCILKGKNHVVEIANALMLEIWGKTAGETINKPLFEGLPEARGQGIESLLENVFLTGEKFVANERAVNLPRSGNIETVYVNFVYEALKEPDGTISGIVAIASDVTLQVMARKKIEESEERFRTMAEATDLLIAVGDETGDAIYFNKAWMGLTGRKMEDLLKFGWADLLHPEDKENFLKIFREAFAKREPFYGEFRILNKDGQYRWLLAKWPARFRPDGSFAGYISSCIDITERKQTERALSESEKRIRSLVESVPFPIGVYVGREMRVELANQSIMDIWGKGNDVIGKLFSEVLPELDNQEVFTQLDNVFCTGIPFHAKNQQLILNVDGKPKPYYFNYSLTPLFDTEGKVYGVMNTGVDLTDLNITKQKAEESEKRFRSIANSAPVLIWMADPDKQYNFFNKAWLDFTGHTMEQESGNDWAEAIHPEDFQKYNDIYIPAFNKHEEFYMEYRLKRFDGEYRWISNKGVPRFTPDNSFEGYIGACMDIHEQTINQRKLRESEERLKELSDRLSLATEGTQLGIWDLDLKNKTILHSSRLAQIFGNSDGSKIFTLQELRQYVHPADIHPIVEKSFEDALMTGTHYCEARIIHPDKTIHWIRVRGKVMYDEAGVAIRILGTIIDITESQGVSEKVGSLAAIVQSSDDAIIGKDLNGIVTSWNAAAERIFGYTDNEMIGKSVTILMPPDRVNEEPNILAQLKSGRRVDHFETKRISKDKRVLDISLTISPVRDNKGNIVGASKIARDITSQKHAERLIIEREQKFRLLADSMPQFVWTADAAGNLNYFNKAVLDYAGLPCEVLEGEGWLQIVHPDDREENIKLWIQSMATGRDFVFEHRFRATNGEYRWQLSRAVPQRNSIEEIQMWVGTSTDIQEMKELDQQKDYFISLASHELKTPITSIKGYVQILQSLHIKSEDVFLKNSLKIIDKQVATLTNLISELLDLSKIKTGSLQLNKEEFKMNDLIEEIIDEIKHINPDYLIAFSNETEAFVYGDRERIGQVLINFITNAIKYSPASKKVTVSIFKKDGSVGLSVEDSGIGISKKDQERIFERFYRVEGKNEKTFPGFGIGLFIASEIISRHNGTIGVTSEPGKGSTFYFSLPLDKQNE